MRGDFCTFGVEVGLSPYCFVTSHVYYELDAVQADCLRSLNGAGEEDAKDYLCDEIEGARRLHFHGYRLVICHLCR